MSDDEIRAVLRDHTDRYGDSDYWDALGRMTVDPELKRECVRRAINASRREAYYSNYEYL